MFCILKKILEFLLLYSYFVFFLFKYNATCIFFISYRRFQNGVGYLFVIEYSNTNIRPVFVHILSGFHPVFVRFSGFFFFHPNITAYTILKTAINKISTLLPEYAEIIKECPHLLGSNNIPKIKPGYLEK